MVRCHAEYICFKLMYDKLKKRGEEFKDDKTQ
jgi:hypothetical protein